MSVFLIGSERESLSTRAESFKELVKKYLETRGFTIDIDSGIEGSFEDLGCFNPAGERVYVEAKDMKVGIGDRDNFLIPFGKHLQAYSNRRFKLIFAIRELRTVKKFKETFCATVEKQTIEDFKTKIRDAFLQSGRDSLVKDSDSIGRIDLKVIHNLVLDTEIIQGKYLEWAIQERPTSSPTSEVASDSSTEALPDKSQRDALDDIFQLKDDISRKKMLLDCISGPEDEILKKALMILTKFFPDDYDVVSTVLNELDGWSDQTVEDAFFAFLIKTKDNRIPETLFKIASDPRRGKPSRRTFFELLGKIGQPEQLDALKRLSNRECDEKIKRWIDRAIIEIKERYLKTKPTEDYYRPPFGFGFVKSDRVLSGKECYWRISDALKEILRLYKVERDSEWFAQDLVPSDIVLKLIERKLDDIEMEVGLCKSEHQDIVRFIVRMIRESGVMFFHPEEGRNLRMRINDVQNKFAILCTERSLEDLL